MIRTIIESPFGAPTPEGIARHVRYARLCMLDCLRRGESPYASHLLYPQVWDDMSANERSSGMSAGHEWYRGAKLCAVYEDLGISPGMEAGINVARAWDVELAYRTLPPDLFAMLDGDAPLGTEGAT